MSDGTEPGSAAASWPFNGGAMGRRIREHDWSATPLGSPDGWPPELKTATALMLDTAFPAALVWGEHLTTLFNDAFLPILGDKPEPLGRSFAEIWAEAWVEIEPMARRAYAGEATFLEDFGLVVNRFGQPEQAYFTFAYSPVRLADGTVAGMMDIVTETTAAVAARQALRESEARFRSFAEHSADTIWIKDLRRGALVYLSPAFESMFGEERGTVLRDLGRWAEIVHPEDRERAGQAMPRLLEGEPYSQEYRIVRPRDGVVRWIRDTGFPIRDADGRIGLTGGIAQDVTDARTAAEHQAILLAELQHRARNSLALIRSLARRTADSAETAEDYASELDGRLAAFARVQAAVTRNPTGGVDLEYLVSDELSAHAVRDGRQVRLEGPSVRLRPKAAETIGLAVHELTTNAVKHGALASPKGRLLVTWVRTGSDDRERLVITWKESGVAPGAAAPVRQGFGLDVLLRTLAHQLNATANHVIEADGLRYRVEIPLSGKVLAEPGRPAPA